MIVYSLKQLLIMFLLILSFPFLILGLLLASCFFSFRAGVSLFQVLINA
jgi:hypothetical protein